MKKIPTAKEILVGKGYQASKFDAKGFNELVANFFVEHEVSATILIKPKRFVEIEGAPECGYANHLDTDVWLRRIDDPDDEFCFSDYILALRKGLVRPTIVVDEPYTKNAVYMLEMMGGFVVKKHKQGSYIVSLV